MSELNDNPPLNHRIPKEDWEHVIALSRKYSLLTIYKLFMNVHPQSKRESSVSSTSQSSGFISSKDSSRGSFASSGHDFRNSLTSNSSIQSCGSPASNSDISTYGAEQIQLSNTPIPDVSAQPPIVPPKPFFCTFCAELGSTTTFGRKHDWKVHEIEFHCGSREWPCCACNSVFDRHKDFEKHFKNAHSEMNRLAIPDVGIELQPKRIFGCGFSGCREVLTSQEARFHHVAHHMEKQGAQRYQWKYSIMINNLLRQPAIRPVWKTFLTHHLGIENLLFSWGPATSRRLRQKLECQDFSPDVQSLVKAAYILGHAESMQSTHNYDQSLHDILQVPIANAPPHGAFTSEPRVTQQPPPSQRSQPTNGVSPSIHVSDDAYYMPELANFPLPPSMTQNAQFFGPGDVSKHTFGNFIQSNPSIESLSDPNYAPIIESQAVSEANRILQDSSIMEFSQDAILTDFNTTAEATGPIPISKLAEPDSRLAFQFHDLDSPMEQHGQTPRHGSLRSKWRLRPRSHEKTRPELQSDGHNASPIPQVAETPLHVSQHQSPRSPGSLPDA